MSDNIIVSCINSYCGHAFASGTHLSLYSAMELARSLLKHKKLNIPDIFAGYMELRQNSGDNYGTIISAIYSSAKEDIVTRKNVLEPSRDHFLFSEDGISIIVTIAHEHIDQLSDMCGPVHRSFPLIFFPWINDDDIFQVSQQEASITHASSIAGEVSGIVNYIGRQLLRGKDWDLAVADAFTIPRLNDEVQKVRNHYGRPPTNIINQVPTSATVVLTYALNAVQLSHNFMEAVLNGKARQNQDCLPIVGVLAALRWRPELGEITEIIDSQLATIIEIGNQVDDLWPKP